jgi:hypothetical protein
VAVRIMRTNRIQAATTVLTASSFESTMPLVWLRDQLMSKVTRFRLGWDVTTGVFDRLDFKEAGTARVGTVAAGNYATGALYAAAVTTAMNNAPGHVNTYAVTYDAPTKKFTIARTAGAAAVDLPFATGANFALSVHRDLGFADTDLTGATTYTGGTAVYQSRRWIGADLGSSLAVQVGIVRYHNSGAGGAYKLRASNTSVADAITTAAIDQTLGGDSDTRIGWPNPTIGYTRRYWALLIDDVTNTVGFNEVGIWYAGPYDEPAFNYIADLEEIYEELSDVQFAIAGAHFTDYRRGRRTFALHFEEHLDADRTTFLAIKDATLKGKSFFTSLKPTGAAPYDTIYGYRPAEMRFPLKGPSPTGQYWDIILPFSEALP